MSKFQRSTSPLLETRKRQRTARECIDLLGNVNPHAMTEDEWTFYCNQLRASKYANYRIQKQQLQWLRGLVQKYAVKETQQHNDSSRITRV